MVRKNATAAIVGHSGMQLIEEQIADLEIDTSHDDRPILNALRGKSKSELSATKQIMVRLDDPELDADRLSLTQNANVQPELMQVRTTSNQPTGKLEHYETTLDAKPSNEGTAVTVTVDMRVQVKVPKLFTGQADKRVRSAANKATDEQESAIRAFISDHAKELIVLPEL